MYIKNNDTVIAPDDRDDDKAEGWHKDIFAPCLVQ